MSKRGDVIIVIAVLFIGLIYISLVYPSPRLKGDLNEDGIVNLEDISIFRDYYLLGASDYAIDQNTCKLYTSLDDVLDKNYLIWVFANHLKSIVSEQDPNCMVQKLIGNIIYYSGWEHLRNN